VLDTTHIGLMCHSMYYYLVVGYNDPAMLDNGVWTLYLSIALNTLLSFIVQCFFTERIYRLCSPRLRLLTTTIIGLTVLGHFVLGMETVVQFFIKSSLSKLHEVTYSGALPFGILAVLSDVLIALALCILLGSNRSDFKDTNTLIDKLIIIAINRCVLTSAVCIAEVITFIARPDTFYFLAIDFTIGKLYTNSLLASLNSRRSLQLRLGNTRSAPSKMSTSFRLASVAMDDTGDVDLTVTSGTMGAGLDIPDDIETSSRHSSRYKRSLSPPKNRRSPVPSL